MWELDHKEGQALKNWGFWNVVLEKTLERPLDSRENKPINTKWNQPWIFIGRTDAEAPILWAPDVKSQLIGKDHNAGKDWGQENKRETEDRWLGDITDPMDMSLSKLWEIVKDREAWHAAVHGITKSWTHLSDWTTYPQSRTFSGSRTVKRLWKMMREATSRCRCWEGGIYLFRGLWAAWLVGYKFGPKNVMRYKRCLEPQMWEESQDQKHSDLQEICKHNEMD